MAEPLLCPICRAPGRQEWIDISTPTGPRYIPGMVEPTCDHHAGMPEWQAAAAEIAELEQAFTAGNEAP